MSEKNPIWLPIVEPRPALVERVLRLSWLYEQHPVRLQRSQRYGLTVTEAA